MDTWWTGRLRARLLPHHVGPKQLHGRAAPPGSEQACVLSAPSPPSPETRHSLARLIQKPPRGALAAHQDVLLQGLLVKHPAAHAEGRVTCRRQRVSARLGLGDVRWRINDHFVFYDSIGTVKVSPHSAWTNLENHILGTHPFSGTIKWVREQQVRAAVGFT